MITIGLIIIVAGLIWIGYGIKNAPEMDDNGNFIKRKNDDKVKQYNVFGKNIKNQNK